MSAVAHETTIRPPSRWGGLRLGELWEARELVYFLTKRELQIRYKQSVFGVAWAVLQPVALAVIFALFFGRLADVPSAGLPYTLFALAALVPWLFVSSSTLQAAQSLVADANLVSKVYFPRLVIPLGRTLSLLVDLALGLVVLLVAAALWDVTPTAQALAAVGFLVLALATALAGGILFSALNVRYRDVGVAIPLLVQIWLFATPVIYPGGLIDGAVRYVYALNPMVSVVEGFRWSLLGTEAPDPGQIVVSSAVALVGLAAAVAYFRRTEQFFADVI
jgi:lipopolysaccharide transport system permease protein